MITIDQLERLRALRLWHWRTALAIRANANAVRQTSWYKRKPDRYEPRAKAEDDAADQHITFVQTLNDFFPTGDSAEGDDA